MRKTNQEKKGFVRIIIILIVILVIASFIGLNPQEVWSRYLGPVFSFIWNIIVALSGFLVALLKEGVAAFNYLLGLIR